MREPVAPAPDVLRRSRQALSVWVASGSMPAMIRPAARWMDAATALTSAAPSRPAAQSVT